MSPQEWQLIQKNPLQALTDPQIIQKLCQQFAVRPTREAGQNFVIDPSVPRQMAEAAQITKDDFVLEIGPGFGALTVALAEKAGQVLAVEKDPHLFAAAKKILENYKNVELVCGDVLKIPLSPPLKKGETGGFKLVSNLPYSITSAVLRKFTEEEPRPELIVLMTQKEVAERVCAQAGEMSLLSVAVQFYAQPEIVKIIPRGAFWPKPEVESAILKLKVKIPFSPPLTKGETGGFTKRFFQLVRIGFSSRRKQLQNNLAAGLRLPNEQIKQILAKAGFDPRIRAQDLGVEDWVRLMDCLEFTL